MEDAPARQPHQPLVNCIMLISWPKRQAMIQEALASYCQQTYERKILTIVNDGEPCAVVAPELPHKLVHVPAGTSIGSKRNAGVVAVPEATYIAIFDDDDVSLPERLQVHIESIGDGVWHRFVRWFIAVDDVRNIVGFEWGSGYGASLMRRELCESIPWPDVSWKEDHAVFQMVQKNPGLAPGLRESSQLCYIHRRHATNVSAAHRVDVRQNVLPLALSGSNCDVALAYAASLADEAHRLPPMIKSSS